MEQYCTDTGDFNNAIGPEGRRTGWELVAVARAENVGVSKRTTSAFAARDSDIGDAAFYAARLSRAAP